MYVPETQASALALMFTTMLCWGSWANSQKLADGWRFELFYWDYVFSVLCMSLLFAVTLGSIGTQGLSFLQDLAQSNKLHWCSAIVGGVIFNIGNLLLVGAIALAGMAVAFPVGIGIALLMGTSLNYWLKPQGDLSWLAIGVVLILAAILFDAIAYKRLAHGNASLKGIFVSVLAGILIGVFYPLVARSMEGEGALGPYSTMVFFGIGIFLCNLPFNAYLMKKPLQGAPVSVSGYLQATPKQHLMGWIGGAVWCTGMVFNLVSAQQAGPAIAYAFGQGATLVAAIWGVFVWREFKGVKGVKRWLSLMFVCYIFGLICIYQAAQGSFVSAHEKLFDLEPEQNYFEKQFEQDLEYSYLEEQEHFVEGL